MFKLSKYIICLPLKDEKSRWLLLNGCSGTFQIISDRIARAVIAGEQDFAALCRLDREELDLLRMLGCLIPVDADEEKTVSQICNKIHNYACSRLDVTFIPSYVCNFRCPYCFERSISSQKPQWLREKMTPQLADAIFRGLEDLIHQGKQVGSFTLFGGEPLLPQNREIVHYLLEKCRSYHAPILVVTNGYYLDEYAELLSNYPIDTLKITIDGTKALHDQRRAPAGGESFDRILCNVRTALEKNIAVSLRTNINRGNIHCIPALEAYYQEQGFTQYPKFSYYFKATMACFEPEGNGVSDPEIMSLLGDDCSRYCHNSAYNRIYRPLKAMLTGASAACFKAEYCGAHSGNLVFDPSGKIYSCWDVLTDPRSVIGAVDRAEGKLRFCKNYAIWQSRTVDTIPYCKSCKYKLFCGGGCAAQGLVANNHMNLPFCEDYITRFHQIAVQIAGTLLSE